MENNEFEKVETKKKKRGGIVKGHKKHTLAKIVSVLLVASLLFIFAGCTSSCNPDKNDPSIDDPGIVTPVPDPDDPENPNEPSDPEHPDEPDDPVIDPDDPVIDPDDPVIDPDDPVIDPDPSDPTDPDDPENPGNPEIPSDEDIPDSIDKVDEVDEINYFADEFTQILNENYMNELARRLVNRYADANSIEKAEWLITNNNDTQIKELQVKVYFNDNGTRYFKVGKVSFNQAYSVQDIIKGNATDLTYSVAYQNSSVTIDNIEANLDLGKTVIETLDADNTLEGDIWCSIGSPTSIAGNTYREITVYQITDDDVQSFVIWAFANGTSDPKVIKNNIENNKINGTGSQSTEYTFAGEKIEQANASSQNLANYNYYFDDEIELC